MKIRKAKTIIVLLIFIVIIGDVLLNKGLLLTKFCVGFTKFSANLGEMFGRWFVEKLQISIQGL